MDSLDKDFRFLGAKRILGESVFSQIRQKKIMIVGLGGVGSWVVEALARSGFNKLILVDLDEICVSNINRQIHALESNVGRLKAQALKERIYEIHPDCEVEVIEDFFEKDNVSSYLKTWEPDLLVDATDSLGVKCEMAAQSKALGIDLLVAGSAGGRILASSLKVADLAQTYEDDLLHQMRKRLRQKHGFPRGKKKFKITCVFSSEPKTCHLDPSASSPKNLDCQSGLGSLCHVTASMGLLLVEQSLLLLQKRLKEISPP